jgi:hypothetical protein
VVWSWKLTDEQRGGLTSVGGQFSHQVALPLISLE